jgi:hypothetical protein
MKNFSEGWSCKMKRIGIFSLFFTISLSLFAQNASDFVFTVEKNEASITGYKGITGNFTIPEKLDGALVTSIELRDGVCQNVKTITIPSGVKDIGIDILVCPNLESITVSESNMNFKAVNGVLYDKSGKTLLFYPYAKKDVSFTVPQGVETIGGGVGSSPYGTISVVSCTYLKAVIIPASVKLIEPCAFAGCENLANVVVPSEGIVIEYSAFFGCEKLEQKIRNELEKRFGEDLFWGPW